jgi:3',5'-cyclic AMP phosphodiesterase CpdA
VIACLALGVLTLRGAQPAQAPFFFVQLSDPQFGMFTEDRDFVQESANFEFAIATVNRIQPAFVIVTGDLVNNPGDPAQIAEYKRIAGKLDKNIPLYNVAGNHDVGNIPTEESVAAYQKQFGADHYTFRYAGMVGIVLNSSLIHSPQGAPAAAAEQERWLRSELDRARGARRVVVFQHHPWFLESAAEPDQYFNIPLARRTMYLDLFHQAGVKSLFAGHYHRNATGRDGDVEMITTGPVGKPLAGESGIRVVIVKDTGITHRYYNLGEMPVRIELDK